MDVVIRDDYDQMSKYAAGVIAEIIKSKPGSVL